MQHCKLYFLSLFLLIAMLIHDADAQSDLSPGSAVDKNGIAYNSGPPSQFSNPANLMIRAHNRTFQLIMGLGNMHFTDGIDIINIDRFPYQIQPYFRPAALPKSGLITSSDLQQMFGKHDRYSSTQSYSFIPLGLTWMNNSSARSIAVRSRGLSSFEMNKNWYVANSTLLDEDGTFNRYLNAKYHVFHEVSFGFAREVTMFNRWQSGLNTLLIGMAPKVVIGGMHANMNFRSEYTPDGDIWSNTKFLEAQSSGDMNKFITELITSGQFDRSFLNNVNQNSNLDFNGFGIGLDAGLTYIMPLGNDISLSPFIKKPLRKSLRFSIAVTDLGMVRYHKNPGNYHFHSDNQSYDNLPQSSDRIDGKPGEIIRYLHDDSSEQMIFESIHENDNAPFIVHLPSKLHIGTAFQYNWFVSLLDFNYRLQSADYEKNGWRTTFGTEITLLRFFPVQGSIHLEPGRNVSYGIGAGFDFGFVHTSASIRLLHSNSKKGLNAWQANSVSALGLHIRF